jgi:hypothetical protein
VYRLDEAYGRLDGIYSFQLPQSSALGLSKPQTFVYAVIRSLRLDRAPDLGIDLHYYSQEGALEVIDINYVQCLVGRINLGAKCSSIIDRSGSLARSVYIEDPE